MGWLIGPSSIITPTLAATTRIVFCTNSPLQEAVAAGLEQAKERNFFEIQTNEYAERRDLLLSAFDKLGMKYTMPEGSYFVLLASDSRKMSPDPLTSPLRFRIYPTSSSPKIILSLKVCKAEGVISSTKHTR